MYINDEDLSRAIADNLSGLPPENLHTLCRLLAKDLREARDCLEQVAEEYREARAEGPGAEAVLEPDVVTLAADEWLSGRPPDIRGLRVVVEGDTGIGKTRYVLDHLAREGPVVLLVPAIAQVKQIASRYGTGTRLMSFVHGQSKPERLRDTVVSTYDQLDYITGKLGENRSRYVLVVDEVHKLYQAGNYRARALQRVLEAIDGVGTAGGFARLLGLSATIQPELLDFVVDQWVIVERPQPFERQVAILEYEGAQNLAPVVHTLLREGLLPRDRLNAIRYNGREDIEKLAEVFRRDGYRCVVAHSQNQDEDDVQQMLATQAVSDHDLLLTTRLLDEGIDIDNDNLGCVHLIGPVHSAELRQFLGRFRRSNPEVYLHIDVLPSPGEPVDINAERAAMEDLQRTVHEVCEATLRHVERHRGPRSSRQVEKYVRNVNATHRPLCEFDLLIVNPDPGSSQRTLCNRPGLLGYLYGLDTENHYATLDMLEERLAQQLPGVEIRRFRVPKQPPDNAIEADLSAATSMVQEARLNLVGEIAEQVRQAVAAGKLANAQEAIHEYADLVGQENTAKASMVRSLSYFTQHVAAGFEAAVAMLGSHEVAQGAQRFAKGLDDELVREFHRLLAEHRGQVAPGSQDPDPLKIPRDKAEELVREALERLSLRSPTYQISNLLGGDKRRGVTRRPDGSYEVTAQFVTKLFRDFTDSDTDPVHNKRHYLFRGLAWRGLQYAALRPPMASLVMPTRRNREA